MAFYFYKVKGFNSEAIERLYNCADDGLLFDKPEIYHIDEVGDYTIAARNKEEALKIFIDDAYANSEDYSCDIDLEEDYDGWEDYRYNDNSPFNEDFRHYDDEDFTW